MSALDGRLQKLEEKVSKVLDKLKRMDDLQHNMQVVHESLQAFNKDFEDFRVKFEKEVKGAIVMKQTVQKLEADNVGLRQELKMLRSSMEDLFSSSRACDIEIVGLSPTSGEDLRKVITKIGKKISMDVDDKHVTSVARKQGKDGKIGLIEVSFCDKTFRDSFLDKARKSRLKGQDLGVVGGKNPVYFNECLSPFSRSLLFKVRNFRRENAWKFAWVRDGKIFLRKAEKEPAVRVLCEADLHILK